MITITNIANGRPNNVSSFNTSSITPQNGSLLLLAVGNRLDSSPSNIPSPSGVVTTWTEIGTVVHPTGGGANQGVRVTLFIGLVSGSPSGQVAVSFGGQTQLDSSYTIEQITGADIRTNGISAVIQQASGSVTSTGSQSLSLATLTNVQNIIYAAFYNGGGAPTVGSGFTLLSNPGGSQMLTEYAQNNTPPSYSYTGPNASAGYAIEIGIAKTGGSFLFNLL